jgi:hypothetical protein
MTRPALNTHIQPPIDSARMTALGEHILTGRPTQSGRLLSLVPTEIVHSISSTHARRGSPEWPRAVRRDGGGRAGLGKRAAQPRHPHDLVTEPIESREAAKEAVPGTYRQFPRAAETS